MLSFPLPSEWLTVLVHKRGSSIFSFLAFCLQVAWYQHFQSFLLLFLFLVIVAIAIAIVLATHPILDSLFTLGRFVIAETVEIYVKSSSLLHSFMINLADCVFIQILDFCNSLSSLSAREVILLLNSFLFFCTFSSLAASAMASLKVSGDFCRSNIQMLSLIPAMKNNLDIGSVMIFTMLS
jgi:hypothetical protein